MTIVPESGDFQTADQAQNRCLAAARRAQQDEEFRIGDLEADVVDDRVAAKLLAEAIDLQS